MENTHQRRGKWLFRGLKGAVLAVVGWGVYSAIDASWASLHEHEFTLSPAWAVAAGGLYLVGLLPSGWFWFTALKGMDQHPQFSHAMAAYYIGHLGKYAPGKAMVVVLRTYFIRGDHVRTSVAAVAAVLETLTMMSTGAFLAAVMILLRYREHTTLVVSACGLLVVGVLPTLPPVFRRLVALLPGRISSAEEIAMLQRVNFRLILLGWLMTACGWLAIGASLWATLQALGVAQADLFSLFPLYLASVTLAVVAGFLSLIPGGAGVRELVLGVLVAGQFGDAIALLSALFLRLIWLGAELLIAGLCYAAWLARRRNSPAPPSIE